MSRLDLKVGDKARVKPADRSIVPTGWTVPWLYGLVAGFCSAEGVGATLLKKSIPNIFQPPPQRFFSISIESLISNIRSCRSERWSWMSGEGAATVSLLSAASVRARSGSRASISLRAGGLACLRNSKTRRSSPITARATPLSSVWYASSDLRTFSA